jgi:hypothetical protein
MIVSLVIVLMIFILKKWLARRNMAFFNFFMVAGRI